MNQVNLSPTFLDEFYLELNEFMSARHGYKNHKCRRWVNKVDARCSKFILTLSFSPDNSVNITSIQFNNPRKGHCSALVDFIDSVSIKYNIPRIYFISVSTLSMLSFLKKNLFLPDLSVNSFAAFVQLDLDPDLPDSVTSNPNWYRPTPFGSSPNQLNL